MISNEKDVDRFSSMAKYSIAILSALIILFPSTYTFIKPPYVYDFLLLIGFGTGLIGFFLNCYVLVLRDVGTQRIFSNLGITSSVWGLLLTFLTLAIVFAHIFFNIYSDRTSSPEIVSLKINPLNPKLNSLVQFSGHAEDQDSDYLKWEWKIRKKDKFSSDDNSNLKSDDNSNLKSDIKTAYWIPIDPGRYVISATVSDEFHKSSAKEIEFIVNINEEYAE